MRRGLLKLQLLSMTSGWNRKMQSVSTLIFRKVNGLKEVEGLDSELERLFKNEKKDERSKFATCR